MVKKRASNAMLLNKEMLDFSSLSLRISDHQNLVEVGSSVARYSRRVRELVTRARDVQIKTEPGRLWLFGWRRGRLGKLLSDVKRVPALYMADGGRLTSDKDRRSSAPSSDRLKNKRPLSVSIVVQAYIG
jgi:hypothetical protein